VKICDCIDGIIVKPGGHLSIIGKPDSMITIEGVADPPQGSLKLYGEGQDTIMYANIKDLYYGVAHGVQRKLVLKHCNISHCNYGIASAGSGMIYIDSCTIDSCNGEGIYLNGNDGGYIKHCTITHNGESGIRLNGVVSTFEVGYNTITGNNIELDSIYEALHIYNCSPLVYDNIIEDNEQDGVGAYNESYPSFYKDPNAAGGALNRLTENGKPETNRHMYLHTSAPILNDGHNDIFNSLLDTTALIVGEKVPVEGTYLLSGNYYGGWGPEPSWAFDLDCDYDFVPPDKTPNTMSLHIDAEAAEAFDAALDREIEGHWAAAAAAYLNVVRDYPESYFSQASLDRMLGCYQALQGNVPGLQVMYEVIRDSTRYDRLFRKARQMAIRCLVARRQYDQAISRLEAILQEPNIEHSDSLYTLIDIADVHMAAYYDSLVCSWDPECASIV
jgi:parallel beta-helix repeat protein